MDSNHPQFLGSSNVMKQIINETILWWEPVAIENQCLFATFCTARTLSDGANSVQDATNKLCLSHTLSHDLHLKTFSFTENKTPQNIHTGVALKTAGSLNLNGTVFIF